MTSRRHVKRVPQPRLGRRARLRVLLPAGREQEQGQDCGACRNQPICFADKIKEEHIITNLLVCRIKRGIDVSRSARLFLRLVRPKLRTLAKNAVRGVNIDIDIALADLESQTIEYLQHHYIMGEIAYPLHYLFGQPNGVVRHFANNYARKARKYESHHAFTDGDELAGNSKHDEHVIPEEPGTTTDTDETREARKVLEDGITLSLHEYRVARFCLHNATEAKRPLNGLHVYLAKTMGVARARVTRIWADSAKKLVREVRGELS